MSPRDYLMLVFVVLGLLTAGALHEEVKRTKEHLREMRRKERKEGR